MLKQDSRNLINTYIIKTLYYICETRQLLLKETCYLTWLIKIEPFSQKPTGVLSIYARFYFIANWVYKCF